MCSLGARLPISLESAPTDIRGFSRTCPPDHDSRRGLGKSHDISAEIHNTGTKASDDPQDLDQCRLLFCGSPDV